MRRYSPYVGDRWEIVWPLRNLGWLAQVVGDDGRVRALLQEYVDWSRDKADVFGLALILHILGAVVYAQGDAAQASALLQESLVLQQRRKASTSGQTLPCQPLSKALPHQSGSP